MFNSQLPTYKDLFEFVLKNKTNKTFIGFTELEIFDMLTDAVKNGTLFFATDAEGKLIGMILFEIRKEDNVVFVSENLSMSMATLRLFAKMSKQQFPDMKLEWWKHGRHKRHNTQKFYQKLKI